MRACWYCSHSGIGHKCELAGGVGGTGWGGGAGARRAGQRKAPALCVGVLHADSRGTRVIQPRPAAHEAEGPSRSTLDAPPNAPAPRPLCPLAPRRQNLEDALAKVQAMIDEAVEYVTPKEIDPETIKRVKAQ